MRARHSWLCVLVCLGVLWGVTLAESADPVSLTATIAAEFSAAPPPLVLIHGIRPLLPCDGHLLPPDPVPYYQDQYWRRLDQDLAAAGFSLTYAMIESDLCHTVSIEENVPYLIDAIDRALAKNPGQEKVVLIAHSMGGLISRAYIENPGLYRDDVAAIYTLGAPHLGTSVAALAGLIGEFWGSQTLAFACSEDGLSQEALCQFADDESDPTFQEAYELGFRGSETFNATYAERAPGVTYHLIGGDVANILDRGAIGAIIGLILDGPDDGIVPLGSSLGVASLSGRVPPMTEALDRIETYELHVSEFAIGNLEGKDYSYFTRNIGLLNPDSVPPQTFTYCLQSSLARRDTALGHVCGAVSAVDAWAQRVASGRPWVQTPPDLRHLAAGVTHSWPVGLEGGPAAIVARSRGGALNLTLRDPAGQMVSRDAAHFIGDAHGGVYFLADARPGVWQVQAQAVAAADVTIYALLDSPVRLAAATDAGGWYQPGAPIAISAALAGDILQATLMAELSTPAERQQVTLNRGDDGIYRGLLTAPTRSGYAALVVRAEGISHSGVPFERRREGVVQVATDTVRLTGAFSAENSPSLLKTAAYPDLVVHIGLASSTPGVYGLSADLIDASGRVVAHSNNFATLPAGTDKLSLRFRGDSLPTATGVLTLSHVNLFDYSHGGLLAARDLNGIYQFSPARLTPPQATAPSQASRSLPTAVGHTCSADNPGPYAPGSLINLTWQFTPDTTLAYPAWLEAYVVDAPDAWQVQDQSAPPPDAGGYARPLTAQACAGGLAYWGLPEPHFTADNDQAPPLNLLGICDLRVDQLPASGSMTGLWGDRAFPRESFELTFPPPGWGVYETGTGLSDGGVVQRRLTDEAGIHVGVAQADLEGGGLLGVSFGNAREWLVMPPHRVSAGEQLIFWQRRIPELIPRYDYTGVWVSTGGGVPTGSGGDFVELAPLAPAPDDNWQQVTLDLSAYAGQTVYLAFYQLTRDDNLLFPDYTDDWLIDDVTIYRAEPYTFTARYVVSADAGYQCPGSPTVGLTSALDPQAGLSGLALGDLAGPNVSRAGCNISQACPLPAGQLLLTVSANGVCPGVTALNVPVTNQTVTYCYAVANNGPTQLRKYRLTDPELGLNNRLFNAPLINPGQTRPIFQKTITYNGNIGACYNNGARVRAYTPTGFGQPQGTNADVPFSTTSYDFLHTTPNNATRVCITAP